MTNIVSVGYLALAALFFLFTTVIAAARPGAFAAQLGLAIANAGGANEIRAQYAGFFLAAAVLCILALASVVTRMTGLYVLAVIFGGLFVGRLFSLAVNGGMTGFGATIRALYVVDGVGFVAAAALIAANRAT